MEKTNFGPKSSKGSCKCLFPSAKVSLPKLCMSVLSIYNLNLKPIFMCTVRTILTSLKAGCKINAISMQFTVCVATPQIVEIKWSGILQCYM